jgi:hypothetical protein
MSTSQSAPALTAKAILPKPRAVASAASSLVAKVAGKKRHNFVGLGLGEVGIEMKGVHISTSKPRAQPAADLRCQACGGVRSKGRRPMSTSQSAPALTAKAILPKPTPAQGSCLRGLLVSGKGR